MFSTTLPVHLFLDTAGTSPHVVIERLRAFPQVQYLAQTSGRSSVFATVHAASEEATATLVDEVYDVPGVAAVRSLPVLAVVGRGSGWDPQLLSAMERERCLELAGNRWAAEDSPRPPRLEDAERQIVEMLQQDGRASAASLGRASGLAPSTAHRVVRRVLDNGWVRPRVEIEPALLGFATPFVLQLEVAAGAASRALTELTALPQTRFTTRVAGPCAIVCTGLVSDRGALAQLIDHEIAGVSGVTSVEVDIVLGEQRRYWMDRDPVAGLGAFTPPPLL
jgi:DNA-binding Lrp family transcriptional regulator